MKALKIVFMGTPIFACAILESLLNEHTVIGVVSQPDKKVGRKQVLEMTPVKKLALAHDIPVFQPIRIKEDYENILALAPDLIVTCAYGQMIPEVILNFPEYGSLNVHASLLPKLRGGAPIHKAIITGETTTGVSIMRMVKKMDAGDYMLQKSVAITEDMTTSILHDELMIVGSSAILEAIRLLESGKAEFVKQDEEKATFAYNISKEEEHINPNRNVKDVYNQIRGLISWPVGYILFQDKKIKIHRASRSDLICQSEIGSLVSKHKHLYLVCDNGCIELLEVQVEGKKRCNAKEFLNGFQNSIVEIE